MPLTMSGTRKQLRRKTADDMRGRFIRTPEGMTIVVSSWGHWELLLDVDTPEGPPSVFFGARPATRIAIPYRPLHPFSFEISRRGLIGKAIYDRRKKWGPGQTEAREAEFAERVQPRLREPDIAFGYGEFDYEFSFSTEEPDDERLMRELMADREVRGMLQGQRYVRIRARQNDDWFDSLVDKLPEDVGVLYFEEASLVKDMGRLREMQEILKRLASSLERVGVAGPARPPVFGPGTVGPV